jgi:methionyl-tRNA formyltransferase
LRIDRVARACTPAPGAWCTFRDRRVKLGPVTPVEEATLAPGEIRADGGVVVGTGSTAVRLGEVRPEGKAAMAATDWVRGLRLQPGERLA